MTRKEFHTLFNVLLDKSEAISHPAFISKEKDIYINMAIRNLSKTRYSGNNVKRTGFQQDQKRTDDLRMLVKTTNYTALDTNNTLFNDGNTYSINSFPSDYWFSTGETCTIEIPIDTETSIQKDVDVTECTIDNITNNLNNSLSGYRLRHNSAKPLRLYCDNTVYLYTDENYKINKYSLTYMCKPEVFERTNSNEDTEYAGMPEHLHDEIVAYAVRLALASISDERYQIYTAETQINE